MLAFLISTSLAFLRSGSYNFSIAKPIFGTMRLVEDYVGSTSSFYRIEDGMILKALYQAIAERDAYKVTVEKEILERLGEHSRIIKYVIFAYFTIYRILI